MALSGTHRIEMVIMSRRDFYWPLNVTSLCPYAGPECVASPLIRRKSQLGIRSSLTPRIETLKQEIGECAITRPRVIFVFDSQSQLGALSRRAFQGLRQPHGTVFVPEWSTDIGTCIKWPQTIRRTAGQEYDGAGLEEGRIEGFMNGMGIKTILSFSKDEIPSSSNNTILATGKSAYHLL